MYNDAYNRKIANTVLARSRRKATNIDRLNGSGMAGGAADVRDTTQREAAQYFKQENQNFEDDITMPDVKPRSVIEERAKYDLGAGKYSGGSGMVGFPDRAPLSAVEPGYVIRERAGLDLGAGRSGAGQILKACGGAMLRAKFEAKEMGRGAVTKSLRSSLPHGMKGMAAKMSKMLLKKGRGRCSGGKKKYEVELDSDAEECGSDMEGEGFFSSLGDAWNAAKTNVKNFGKAIGEAAYKSRTGSGGAMPLHMSGCGDFEYAERQVGGKACCAKCAKCKCGKGRSGAGMCGGFGPVSPTTESLYGYDNRAQSKGLMPPPSVNQQAGMCGGVRTRSGKETAPSKQSCCFPASFCRGNKKFGRGMQPVSVQQMGHNLLPKDQLPSGVGGGKMEDMFADVKARMSQPNMAFSSRDVGRTQRSDRPCMSDARYRPEMQASGNLAMTKDYASNSGAIIPNLQSKNWTIGSGSGARSARGAMVSKLMKEKGMSLGQASKYIKEHKM